MMLCYWINPTVSGQHLVAHLLDLGRQTASRTYDVLKAEEGKVDACSPDASPSLRYPQLELKAQPISQSLAFSISLQPVLVFTLAIEFFFLLYVSRVHKSGYGYLHLRQLRLEHR